MVGRGDADIRGINMAIYVEVGLVAVHALANVISEPSDGEDVSSAVKRPGVVSTQAFVGEHLIVNGRKAGIVGLKQMCHCPMIQVVSGQWLVLVPLTWQSNHTQNSAKQQGC